jgi:hypothetical protein
MGNDRRKQKPDIHRVILPEITPLEIWDCITSEGILWDSMYQNSFPLILKKVIEDLQSGTAVSASKTIINSAVQDFDALYIGGGGARCDEIISVLQELNIPVIVSENPVFSGVAGGKHLLEQSDLKGLVVDIGQTQIKISTDHKLHTYQRDLKLLPIRDDEDTAHHKEQLQNFYRFVGSSIAESVQLIHKPEGIVLALPCWIGSDCSLGGSSYAGMKGNSELIEQILNHAELDNIKVILLNDAELTCYTALSDKRLDGFKKVLVVTLGFGVGAAVLETV